MLWQEGESQKEIVVSQTIVDLIFDMNCRCLPVDHAYPLSQAIEQVLPWFASEPQAGLHLIYGAGSGNGWNSPTEQNDLLYLSRRTKLTLRLPQTCITATQILTGKTLDITGYSLKIGSAKEKPLTKMPVLFARHVIANPTEDENAFLDKVAAQLQEMGIDCRKALCGKSHRLKKPETDVFTRSLMIADLKPQDSITLQQQGLGGGRKMGCGLFVPHKDIKPVNSALDQ